MNIDGSIKDCAVGASIATNLNHGFRRFYEPLAEESLLSHLHKGDAVVMASGYYNNNGSRVGGHMTVIYGYYLNSSGAVVYRIRNPWPSVADPWPNPNPGQSTTMTYAQLINTGGSVRWDETVVK